MASDREVFLTTEEVLDYLQVNLRTVYRLIKAGKIPAVRVGRQWRFRKRDIDAWLESSRPASGGLALPDDRQGSGERPRILVVDDEADIRGLVKEILSDEGYDVDVAANAAEARERWGCGRKRTAPLPPDLAAEARHVARVTGTPEAARAFLDAQVDVWGKVVKDKYLL